MNKNKDYLKFIRDDAFRTMIFPAAIVQAMETNCYYIAVDIYNILTEEQEKMLKVETLNKLLTYAVKYDKDELAMDLRHAINRRQREDEKYV